MNQKYSTQKKIFFSIVILTYLVMVLLNLLTPLIADDLQYMAKTEGFFTILNNEYTQYQTWTGRSIVHIIARIFLLMPKIFFNILNPLAFIYVTLLIYILSTKKRYSISKYLVILFSLWLFTPAFGEVFLWETGAANYLWGSTIILTFLAIYHKQTVSQKVKWINPANCVSIFALFFLGLLSGWCNENTSGGAVLLALGYIGYNKLRQQPIPKWMISGLIGAVTGLVIMVKAPGNAIRSTYFNRSNWSFTKKLVEGVFQITQSLQENAFYFILLVMLATVIGFILFNNSEKLILSIGYIFAGIATIYVLAFSPTGLNWGRSYYGGALYLVIALLISWPDKIDKKQLFYSGTFTILIVSFTFSFVLGTIDITLSHKKINERYDYLVQQKTLGNLNPVFANFDEENLSNYPAYSNRLSHVGKDKKAQINRATANYFGLESVASVSEKDWQLIYKNGSSELMNIVKAKKYFSKINNSKYIVLLSGTYSNVSGQYIDFLVNDLVFTDGDAIIGSNVDHLPLEGNPVFSQKKINIGKKQVNIRSGRINEENTVFNQIIIDNVDYSRNGTGLNIVVLSAETQAILDSVAIDTTGNVTR